MDAPYNLNALMTFLAAFRDDVGFQLMDETPLPDDLATPLWEALKLVNSAIETLKWQYRVEETGLTYFVPKGPAEER
ncbi:MAG TPA: hypothetical protein VN137_02640 [Sphingomonas sp.]|nr:hypothetical protein [Sphingomonas sp.]